MAKYLESSFEKDVEFFDLQDNPLPMCDGDECYDLPEVLDFREKIKNAEGIIMAIPVYNFNASSGAKNIVELGGRMLYDKTLGFLCASGGRNSYMSVMSLVSGAILSPNSFTPLKMTLRKVTLSIQRLKVESKSLVLN